MKIKLLLNNFYIKIALTVLLLIFLAVFVERVIIPKSIKSNIIYHQSLWNEYVPEIERLFNAISSLDEKTGLDHVYGSIMSHHIPVTLPKLVDFYYRLNKNQKIKNIIIIGPDHNNAGQSPITISNASFFTAYGELKSIDGLAEKLQNSGLATIEEAPFDREHSVGSQILVISKIFPEARIAPIIIRSNATSDQAKALGKFISNILDEETVLVSSVDFSHYLNSKQAVPIDQVSGDVIRKLDMGSLSLIEVDSPRSVEVFMEVMINKKAYSVSNFGVLNTDDFMENSDNTTGYVFGFWGVNSVSSATLMFVGDIMLSRSINTLMVRNKDWNYPFLKITDYLKNADLLFGNLEGSISKSGEKVGSIYSFRADPKSIEGLLSSGFDVLSIANNHMWDYGANAFSETIKLLKENHIDYVGGDMTYELAHVPLIREIVGTKVSYLAYTNLLPSSLGTKGDKPTIAFPDQEQIILDIQNSKKLADIIIVSFHWGEEYETYHNPYQEKLAHLSIDAGADLIVGHHPHVVQDVENYNGKYIAYSLGNFVFDQNFSDDTRSGMILNVTINNKKIEEVKTQKISFTKTYQPYIIE